MTNKEMIEKGLLVATQTKYGAQNEAYKCG